MEWLNGIIHLLMFIVPTIIICWTAITVWKRYIEYQEQKQERELSLSKHQATEKLTLPMRMQSYERIILFLERIAPENLIIRVHNHGMTARQLHKILVDSIQQEYEHNLSQQVYVSAKGWEGARTAKEETLRVVNMAVNKMKDNATGLDLSQEIFGILSQVGQSPSLAAIDNLKRELKQYM